MKDYYLSLNRLFEQELDKGNNNICIFPLGRIGLEARNILENRYGVRGIYVDNTLYKYNKDVISFENLITRKDANLTVVLCFGDVFNSERYIKELYSIKPDWRIRSVREPFVEKVIDDEYLGEIKKRLRVKKVINKQLKRFGANNDGGYVLVDEVLYTSKIYSFGIGTEFSWDEEMARNGIDVYCYDPTILGIPSGNKKLHFRNIGISGSDSPEISCYSMESIMKENNDENNYNMILKMDVEGAEWDFLDNTSVDILNHFTQIVFEFHEITDHRYCERIIRCLDKINQTHQVIWIHANNNRDVKEMMNGELFPPFIEVTYVKKDIYEFVDTKYDCPKEYDSPNCILYDDIQLRNWGTIVE